MMTKQLRFFFDFQSPYSYVASEMIEEICEKHQAELIWEPMVLGGIFKADDTQPIFQRPKRAQYLAEDIVNVCECEGIAFRQRTEFLFSSIPAMRIVVQLKGKERSKAVHAVFRAAWTDDKDPGNPEVLTELLAGIGLDGQKLLEGAQEQSVKDKLRDNTEEALSFGIFGAPTVILDQKKMFWGHDRLKVLDYFLGKEEQ